MAQLRHDVTTFLWPPRQSMQISVAASTLFTMTSHATVPTLVVATLNPTLLTGPPCSRSSVRKTVTLLKTPRLPSYFPGVQPLQHRGSQTLGRVAKKKKKKQKTGLVYFCACKYVPLLTQQTTKYDT